MSNNRLLYAFMFLVLAVMSIVALRADAAWPSTGSYTAWSKCFKITSQASKIDAANGWYWLDLDDMPIEFHNAAQEDLDDFRVTSDGETAINYRLIFYNASADTGLVAIEQPHGSSGASVDVDSYIYIGNAGASSGSSTSTFPSTLECLYMLQEAPTSNTAVLDYTGNGRNSTAVVGSMTSGDLVAGGPHSGLKYMDFDSNDRITVPSTLFDDCETAGAYTWFGWIRIGYTATNNGVWGAAGTQQHIRVDHVNYAGVEAQHRNSANSADFLTDDSTAYVTENTWHMVHAVYNGSTLKLYLDGIEKSSVTATSLRSATLAFNIGHDNTTYLRNRACEIGMYSTALSADQVKTMYTNETDSGFWAISEHTGAASDPGKTSRGFLTF